MADHKPDPVLAWSLPLVLIGAVCALLALAFRQELPRWFALLLFIGGWFLVASGIGGAVGSTVERLLVTPAGVKWDWVLLPVSLAAAWRYGEPLFLPGGFDLPRFILWMMGYAAMIRGGLMVKDERAKIISEGAAEAEKGEPKVLDWHRDVSRYQVPLALYALGLTLLQMAAP